MQNPFNTETYSESRLTFWKPFPIKLYLPTLILVGATVNEQVAKLQVPPHVPLPTPPTITLPNAQQPLTELHSWLQMPLPINEYCPWFEFLNPPIIVPKLLLVLLQNPPPINP